MGVEGAFLLGKEIDNGFVKKNPAGDGVSSWAGKVGRGTLLCELTFWIRIMSFLFESFWQKANFSFKAYLHLFLQSRACVK